ncbi:MAG: TraR/DksA family transcriptional regulator [Candidatus Brocadiia bacterium]
MTPKKKKYNKRLENQLTAMEQDLLHALQDRLERARSVSAHDPTEFMDMASESEIDDLAARIAESDSTKIDEIEEALRLLKEGEYGVCQRCGEKIAKRRLKARPFATLCLTCKEAHERGREGAPIQSATSGKGAEADVGVEKSVDQTPDVNQLSREMETSELY